MPNPDGSPTEAELKSIAKAKGEINDKGQEGNDISREGNDLLIKYLETHTGVNKSIQSYLSSQRDITGQLQLQIKATNGNKENLKSTLNLSRQVALAIQNSIGPYKDMASIQREQAKNIKLANKLQLEYKTLLTGTREEQQSLKEELQEIVGYEDKSKQLAKEKISLIQEKTNLEEKIKTLKSVGGADAAKIEEELLKSVNERIITSKLDQDLHDKKGKTLKDITTEEAKSSLHIINTIGNLEGANTKLQEQLDKQIAIKDAMGLSGVVLKGINKALGGALGSSSELLKSSEERIKKLVEQRSYYDEHGKLIVGNVSKFRGFAIQLQEIGKSIITNMLDPLVLIKAVLDYSDQTTALQKGMSLTNDEAKELKKTFGDIAQSMDDAAINAMTIQKAAGGINSALGDFAFTFEAPDMQKMVGEAAKFQEKMGGSNEEMTGIVQSSLLTGKGFEELQLGILEVTGELENQTGIRLNEAKLMKQSASVTGEIRAQLGGSVVEISKAIAAAKSFGMELATVAKTANSLLDFEQSIGAELEAELLTGKQLNLEKARLAALTGDYKTLSSEINKNVGDFNDFSNMNVLQQRAMAKAFGMSSDEMADMLVTEENIESLKEKARRTGDKKTLQMLEQRTLQEKFTDAVNKMKQVFVDIVGGPGGKLLKQMANLAMELANAAGTTSGKFVIGLIVAGGIAFNILNTFVKVRKVFMEMKAIMTGIKSSTFAINAAEKLGLINKQQAVNAKVRENLLQKQGVTTEKLSNFHKNAGLGTTLKRNLANMLGIGQKKVENTLEAQSNTLKNKGLLTRIKDSVISAANIVKTATINSLKTIGNLLGITSLSTTVAQGTAETVITAAKTTQNKSMGGLITKGLIYLGTLVAQAAAAIAGASALTLGIGLAGILAATAVGVAYLYKISKPKKTGDFMSRGQNIGESVTPGSLNGNEGMISVGGKTRTFDTNVDEVNISPNAVTGITPKQIPVRTSSIAQQSSGQQSTSDIVNAIKALGEKPGMMQQSTDTLPSPTDLFAENTKIGNGVYQRQNKGQVLFT